MLGRACPADARKVAAYIRWSTEEQGSGTTLQVQRERVGWYVRSQGWELPEELVFVDDGYSGATLNRPGMNALREAVRAGRVETVVVYKLDRLSRSLLDTVSLIRSEWHSRCTLYSATENFDSFSPVGQMIVNILASFAEFERNMIRERTLAGKRKRAQQGRNAGQRYPYGYRRGPDGAWAIDRQDVASGELAGPAAVVRQIFSGYLAGKSMGAIAADLNAAGITAPGGGSWRFGAVGRVLSNAVYSGTYRYGSTTAQGRIPPLVSADEMARAAERRAGRAPDGERAAPARYLLSGIARCGRCGGPLAGSMGKSRRYYVCTGRTVLRRCDCAYVDAGALEAAVLEAARNEISLPDLRREAGRLTVELDRVVRNRREAVSLASAALQTANRRRERLETEFLSGSLDGRTFTALLAKVDAEGERAEARLQVARLALEEAEAAAGSPGATVQLALETDPWAELSPAEARQVLRDLTESLTVYQRKADLTGSRRGNPNPLVISWQPRAPGQGTVTRSRREAPDSS